jgi:hypothetical protein
MKLDFFTELGLKLSEIEKDSNGNLEDWTNNTSGLLNSLLDSTTQAKSSIKGEADEWLATWGDTKRADFDRCGLETIPLPPLNSKL